MPAALYALCDAPDSRPVRVGADVVMQTSRQTQDYLLCADCEDLLNKGGESWLLGKVARMDAGFELYELLRECPPDAAENGTEIYATSRNPRIDAAKISHFAMGVFWKAAVYSWRGRVSEPLIELGKYREEARLFVAGETPFSEHMALTVCVVPPPVKAFGFTNPYRCDVKELHTFAFVLPGIMFLLRVGKCIHNDLKRICIGSNPLRPIVTSDLNAEIMNVFRDVSAGARKSRNVIKYAKMRKG
jgi:hypothetical protein